MLSDARKMELTQRLMFAYAAVLVPPWTVLLALIPPVDTNDQAVDFQSYFYTRASWQIITAFWIIIVNCLFVMVRFLGKLNHNWSLEFLAHSLRAHGILVSFEGYGQSGFYMTRTFAVQVLLVLASAALVVWDGQSNLAITIVLQLLYTFPKGFELLLKRPEARLDGTFVKLGPGETTVVPEIVVRKALLEQIELPTEQFTIENIAERILRINLEMSTEEKIPSAETVKANKQWTEAFKKYTLELDCVPISCFSETCVSLGWMAAKPVRVASPFTAQYYKEVIKAVHGLIAAAVMLANAQIIFTVAYIIQWVASLAE